MSSVDNLTGNSISEWAMPIKTKVKKAKKTVWKMLLVEKAEG